MSNNLTTDEDLRKIGDNRVSKFFHCECLAEALEVSFFESEKGKVDDVIYLII